MLYDPYWVENDNRGAQIRLYNKINMGSFKDGKDILCTKYVIPYFYGKVSIPIIILLHMLYNSLNLVYDKFKHNFIKESIENFLNNRQHCYTKSISIHHTFLTDTETIYITNPNHEVGVFEILYYIFPKDPVRNENGDLRIGISQDFLRIEKLNNNKYIPWWKNIVKIAPKYYAVKNVKEDFNDIYMILYECVKSEKIKDKYIIVQDSDGVYHNNDNSRKMLKCDESIKPNILYTIYIECKSNNRKFAENTKILILQD